MKKIWNKHRDIVIIIILFLVVEAIFLKINDLFPFGKNNSFIKSDVSGQYIPFWSYLKDCFTGNQDFLYSFSNGLGGSMIGIWAYYLLSPFNLIFLLVSKINIANCQIILTVLKFLASTITMFIFLKTKTNKRTGRILGAFCYGFCGYNIAYQMNIMWLDGVILLPLIALGIEKIIKEDKPLLYTITTALSLIVNFYIGFATTIFGGLYFLYALFLNKWKKENIKIILKFALYSILGIGISAIILIPMVNVILAGRDTNDLLNIYDLWKSNFNIMDFSSKFFPGTINNDQLYTVNGLPNIYCGLITIMLMVFYFINTKIPIKNKLLSITVVFILYFSMKINIINLLWHGLKAPTGYPYRYSFLFIFILMILAIEAFDKLNKKTVKQFSIAALITILLSVIVIINKEKIVEIELSTFSMFLVILFSVLLCVYGYWQDKSREKKTYQRKIIQRKNILQIIYVKKEIILETVIIAICLTELLYNYHNIYKNLAYDNQSGYVSIMKKYENIIHSVKENDDSFYRIEKTENQNLNDSLTYDYYGIGHSSSVFSKKQKELLKALGYNYYLDWCFYGWGSTPVLDSILGIKYIISPTECNDNIYLKYVNQVQGYYIYENKYALPLMVLTNGNLELDLDENPFALQEKLFENITGEKDVFIDCVLLDKQVEGLEVNGDYYKMQDKDNNKLTYTFEVKDQNSDLYLFLDNDYVYDNSLLEVNINGTTYQADYIGATKNGILPIKKENIGESNTITIELKFKSEYGVQIRDVYLKQIDTEKFVSAMQKSIDKNYLTEIEEAGNKVEMTVNVQEKTEYVMLTVPYDEAWTIYINGEKVEYEETAYNFIGVTLQEGENKIEMQYIPKGLVLGGFISLTSITTLILYLVICKKGIFSCNKKQKM